MMVMWWWLVIAFVFGGLTGVMLASLAAANARTELEEQLYLARKQVWAQRERENTRTHFDVRWRG